MKPIAACLILCSLVIWGIQGALASESDSSAPRAQNQLEYAGNLEMYFIDQFGDKNLYIKEQKLYESIGRDPSSPLNISAKWGQYTKKGDLLFINLQGELVEKRGTEEVKLASGFLGEMKFYIIPLSLYLSLKKQSSIKTIWTDFKLVQTLRYLI